MNKEIKLILENAKKLRALDEAAKKAHENKINDNVAWQKATEDFQKSYDILAFPGGLTHGLELLKKGDSGAIESAIAFLQADPFFHRSGYIKEDLVKHLKRVTLTENQIQELQDFLLKSIFKEPKREFAAYCKLAAVVADDAFIKKLNEALSTENAINQRQAQYMLDAIEK